MPPRKLHQQALYLEPEKAALLDELAAETRIPKAVLLREAIDDLLTKHDKMNNAWYADIVAALRVSRTVAVRYKSMQREVVWQSKCEEAIRRIDDILASLGKK
jgi:predicted DNA-binding protein